jgi:mono/diheme cytochrome c family protein
MRKIILTALVGCTFLLMLHSCHSAGDLQLARYVAGGQDLYRLHCQNCHGEKGEGLGQLAPPLTDSTALSHRKHKIACFIKNGMSEKIVVNGQVYEDKMPAFPDLQPIDVAQVIVYITNSFGNKQGMYSPEQVMADLKSCR